MRLFLSFILVLFLGANEYALQTSSEITEPNKSFSTNKQPNNVILMIGDGMGFGQLEVTRLMEYGVDGRLYMETLPETALVHTYSANNRVTDSAAGGTALAIGKKTNNEMIGVTPDGQNLPSILDLFKKNGNKTGIITTNKVTDATPAAFTSSVKNRWTSQEEIAQQQFENEIDVILGGGANYFIKSRRNNSNLIDAFKKKGYSYVTNREELKKVNDGQLLGLFHPTNMHFQLDRDELNSEEPNLKEMTTKGLDLLSKDDKGFFVLIEGARIDHASHASDITSIWKETIDFDQTVKYVVEWAKKRSDTLIIVLADHETMGVSSSEAMDIEALKKIKVSTDFVARELSKNIKKESIKKIFKQYTNIELSNKEVKLLRTKIQERNNGVYADQHLAWEIGNIISKYYNVGILSHDVQALSSTGGHTGNMIPLFAYGNGAEQFNGVLDNTDIPKIVAKICGYSW